VKLLKMVTYFFGTLEQYPCSKIPGSFSEQMREVHAR
jgi:hypothetical protein